MKITAIIPYPIWVGTRNQLIVKVETDEGIYGWGESGLSGREKAVVGAIEHYREFLIGREAFGIGALWQEMYRSQYFEGGRVLQAAISAIDIALHDIKAKALKVPVYELLGGKQRDRIPTFASTSEPPGDKMIEQARDLMRGGWSAIRFFPAGQEDKKVFEPRDFYCHHREMDGQGPRGAWRRRGSRHRLPPSAFRRRGRQLLPKDALRYPRLS